MYTSDVLSYKKIHFNVIASFDSEKPNSMGSWPAGVACLARQPNQPLLHATYSRAKQKENIINCKKTFNWLKIAIEEELFCK